MSNTSNVRGENHTNCQDGDRHCESPTELNYFNIFNRTNDINDEPGSENTTVDNGCEVAKSNDDGSYGTKNDSDESSDGTSSPQETIIAFQYQIQTSLPISKFQSSDSSPLVMIEKAISDVLVERYFSNPLCVKGATTENRNRNGTRRRLIDTARIRTDRRRTEVGINETEWTGLTTHPADVVLPGIAGVTCHSELVANAISCFTVGGAFTAVSTMTANASWIATLSKIAIREAMNQQQLNQIHDQIYDVSYVSDDPGIVAPSPSPEITGITPLSPTASALTESTDIARGRDFPIWPWIFVPLVAVLVGIAIYELYRTIQRRRRFIDHNSLMDDSFRSKAASESLNSRLERQRRSVTNTEYGPFIGSFPKMKRSNSSERSLQFVQEHDNHLEPNIVDTMNTDRQEYKNRNNLIDVDVPIFTLDGLDDVMMVNTSNDTDLYYNSIVSSSGHGSSYDTNGLSSKHGQFPSAAASFIT